MIAIPGYTLRQTLYHSPLSTVVRATRDDDGSSAVIKWLSAPTPGPGAFARYRYAWEIGRDLDLPGVSRTTAMVEVDGRPALVTSDLGGESLRKTVAQQSGLSLLESVAVVRQVAQALARLHDARVIHRDINPGNIVVSADLSRVEIIDFDVATRLVGERAEARSARLLEGTLAYISPEQTGRMNRATDHRTDLYSLGVTLYELVCGERPFVSDDPLALVHSHIAVPPQPAHERVRGLPMVVSRIIGKLLEKTPEKRYQSAAGLARDLGRCQEALESGDTLEDFELGVGDVSPWLQVSQHLYGREAATETLLSTFERVSKGARELLLIGGFPGVGKTRLVHEALRDVSLRKGRFASGKYVELNASPHLGLVTALRAVVADMLTGTDEEVAHWRAAIVDALKLNAAVIAEVVPELVALIGEPPPPPMLDPGESLARFQRVMVAFVRVLATPEHPLVLFLDDLQWAGRSSLGLLEALLQDRGQSHLLVIGAFRDAHGSEGLVTRQWRDGLEASGVATGTLALEPLGREAMDALVADTLATDAASAQPLTDLLWERTHGNPFFVHQVLRAMADSGALRFDPEEGRWRWDLTKAGELGITDQVGDLLARRIDRLPEETQTTLANAACLGASFDLATLAAVTSSSPGERWKAAWPALEEGLLVARGELWRTLGLTPEGGAIEAAEAAQVRLAFAHDRVQEAAYASLAPSTRDALHLAIARLLAAEADAERRVFDIANHYNLALGLVESAEERVGVAQSNLGACVKALQASAFGRALGFAEAGLAALGETPFAEQRELALQLARYRADTAQLNGRYDEALAMLDEASAFAFAPPEKAELFDLRMQLHTRTGNTDAAIATGIQALSELFGFEAPTSPEAWGAVVGAEMAGVQAAVGLADPMSLLERPPLSDMAVFLELRILTAMVGPAYVRLDVLPFVVARMVRLSAEHGNAPFSPLGYMTWAVLLCSQGMYQAGGRFGELALKLAELMQARSLEAPLFQIYGPFVQHWTAPLDDVRRSLHRAIAAGVETGSYTFAGWSANNVPMLALARGAPLPDALRECAEVLELVEGTLAYQEGVALGLVLRSFLLELTGDDEGRAAIAAMDLQPPTMSFQQVPAYFELFNHVVFGRWEQANATCAQVGAGLAAATAHIFVPVFRYLEVIIAAENGTRAADAALRATGGVETDEVRQAREAAIATIRQNIQLFQGWTELNRDDRLPYLHHAEAELAALEGRMQDAEEAFDRAASAARDVGMGYAEGLACERAWRWFQLADKPRTARSFLVDAHYAWVRWGADAKARQLETKHPRLRSGTGTARTHSTVTQTESTLDVQAVFRASQAISSQLILDDLLGTLLRTVIESAGAERGLLLLRRDGALAVEATMESAGVPPALLAGTPLDEAPLCQGAVRLVERSGRHLVLGDALASERFGFDPYVRQNKVRSLLCTPVIDKGQLVGVLYLENNLVPDAFTDDRCRMLDILASQAAISIENARFYERQARERASMARFVPSEFVDLVGKSALTEVALGDAVEREMGVVFSDVRSFTSISESMLPMEIFSYLNGYLADAGPVIRAHGGFIDKYIGDAVLALFPSSPEDALQAIIGLYRVVEDYNLSNAAAARPRMDIGAALHWGKVALGTIGETRRLDATVISDTVNTASRLESMTKKWGARAIVSGDVMSRVQEPERIAHRFIGQVVLRGRTQSTPIYDLYGVESEAVVALRDATRVTFEQAVHELHDRNLSVAQTLLRQVLADDPNDRVARYLLSIAMG